MEFVGRWVYLIYQRNNPIERTIQDKKKDEKINVFFFSGTGNTWWVSERICAELQRLGIQATAYSIEQMQPDRSADLITGSDIVGFGFPIYGSGAPRDFMDFLHALPHQPDGKDTLGFVTQVAWSGDGFNFLKKMLQEKGYKLKWCFEFNMPNNVSLPFFPYPYSADYNRFSIQLAKCQRKLTCAVKKFSQVQNIENMQACLAQLLGGFKERRSASHTTGGENSGQSMKTRVLHAQSAQTFVW